MRLAIIALAALAPLPATAQDDPTGPLDTVIACRTTADTAARLACYDRATAALAEAREKKEVVVLDRPGMKKVRRSLFGFSTGKLPFLPDGQEDNELETAIVSLRSLGHGKWAFRTREDAEWRTTEAITSPNPPRVGQAIVIRRAALGSYMAKIPGYRTVRIMRVS